VKLSYLLLLSSNTSILKREQTVGKVLCSSVLEHKIGVESKELQRDFSFSLNL